MSSNMNVTYDLNDNKLKISSIEILILYIITISGIIVNMLTMIYILIIAAYRMKSSCFLFHHCLICLTLSILCLPYSLSFSKYGIRCDYLGNIQVTCVTAQLLNMAAMVASEAYRFEDLIHQDNSTKSHSHQHYQYQLKQPNQSTISCGCLSFGILIIWFSSMILHLGITMIGSERISYYEDLKNLNCNFIIRDLRGYVLTLMWIIITIFSLIITVRYIHKILSEVSTSRRHNQPLLSLAILGQSHGQSIASKDILMQQIEQRIKLNILLIILFIIFWFPLFLVTLCNITFKIPEQILRYLLLFAWSNSSISPLAYSLLLPKCSDLCGFCFEKKRSSTYDSLTSYYNRIGDRFHDIGKWDQFKTDQQPSTDHKMKSNKKFNVRVTTTTTDNDIDSEDFNKTDFRRKNPENFKENSFQLRQMNSSSSNECPSKTNSIIVKEIPFNHDSTSSLSSLTTVTNKQHHLSNGLIVTSSKKGHL